MDNDQRISGFSKLTRDEKIDWVKEFVADGEAFASDMQSHRHPDAALQAVYEEFSENTISNYHIPFGLSPNFLINDEVITVPMAIEESSVVAAASHAAKFWSGNGGFHARVLDTVKVGQVHFIWEGEPDFVASLFSKKKADLLSGTDHLTHAMRKRNGGIKDIRLIDKTSLLEGYYQLFVEFRTADAMGANFINSVLEELASLWKSAVHDSMKAHGEKAFFEVVMAILSNYTPESLVEVTARAPFSAFGSFDEHLTGEQFAEKFVRAVHIAAADPYRAVTHNKGIFNGMDAVVIATGNDFRAVEACGHAYAARDGQYRSLSFADIVDGELVFSLKVPLSVGVVGGLTSSHPLAKRSLEIMGHPDAKKLMQVIAAAGLANNFSAVRSLITKGIQQGHMKMHLTNILRQLGASEQQKLLAMKHFENRTVSFSDVRAYLETLNS
jgi:hydroxymethylglutaryl-CoA reductase